MNIAQNIIEAHKLKFGSLPPLQQCSVSGSALFNADCMDILPLIPDKSVQLILADLPYGTTQCKWDSVLDLNKLWKEYERIITDNGNILLFADEPFTSILITSNLKQFRQRITWDKQVAGNHLNSKKMLLKITEDICLFTPSKLGNQTYNIITTQKPKRNIRDREKENRMAFDGGYVGKHKSTLSKDYSKNETYPHNLWSVNSKQGECNALNRLHPTQKPIELIKKLLLTYSNENDMVLDNTMGVGTTCLGAKELNRSFIGIEKEVKYYELAVERVFPITQSIYKNIQTKENYDKLLSSGMFWEFHPELSGNWDIDRCVVQHCH